MSDSARPALSVVAPCFNEEGVLPEFLHRVGLVLEGLGSTAEIVLVDDGSRDATWQVMTDWAAKDRRVVAVRLMRNHGHQLALTAGLSVCRGERILIIDADLQDPPELLEDMMRLVDAGNDVVYGMRRSRGGESIFKKATAFLFYRVLNALADREIPKDTGDFRLITRRVLEILNSMPETHRFIRGMVSWAGFRQTPLLYDRQPRLAGETKYTLRKMLAFGLDAITSFSVKPLRLAFYAAIMLSGASVLLLLYSVAAYFESKTIRGWTSIIAVVLFALSAQFLFLGLIGEYLGRMYLEAKRRPLFVVMDVIHGARERELNPQESSGYERRI
jgi:polyisoprenyl-phosphate glycosyltransferase